MTIYDVNKEERLLLSTYRSVSHMTSYDVDDSEGSTNDNEDWAAIFGSGNDLEETGSKTCVEETIVHSFATVEARVEARAPWMDWFREPPMDWVELAGLLDDQIDEEKVIRRECIRPTCTNLLQRLKKLENKMKNKRRRTGDTLRSQPTRRAGGIAKGVIKSYSWTDVNNNDFGGI